MTRHARNCTAGAVYTYNEKRRDAAESGYGTNKQRLGKDSVKSFDCCSLTLQPCRNPVVTKDGYLFDKEAILQYIITKKNEYSRKLKEYERLKRLENETGAQKNIAAKAAAASTSSGNSISNMANGNERKLPSFWVPSECPNAGLAKAVKPEATIYCPVSEKPLKSKDLINVKFTVLPNDGSSGSKDKQYICPVTHDIINNAVPCAVLRPTGDVVTMECIERVIKKDWIHPLTNQKLTEKDIIPLQRGGTGYATTNKNLEAKEKRPMMQA